jgi:membrane-associated protease RseP (regulator of RpoE activity)
LWLHILLFLLTVFTTLVIGARLAHNFYANQPAYVLDEDFFPWKWALSEPSRLVGGIPFSLTLMSILFAHEMGHYIACLRYRVYATLPFFVPAPTLIGTLGAFIRIKSPIQSRQALFDIGIAGPIAGFALAVPAMLVGLLLSRHVSDLAAHSELQFNSPLVFQLASWAIPWLRFPLDEVAFHPVAVAAWVGIFMTALNLLPGGQLDGGHIIYAVWPKGHRFLTRITIAVIIPLGIFYFYGWLVWGAVLLGFSRHPRVPDEPKLSGKRIGLAVIAFLMFTVSIHFNPIVVTDEKSIWWHLVELTHKLL